MSGPEFNCAHSYKMMVMAALDDACPLCLQIKLNRAAARIEALEFELKAAKNEIEIADSVIEQKQARIEALEAALKRYQDGFHEWRRRGEKMEAALREIAGTSYMQDQALSDIVNAALAPEQDK